jgi:phosphohistidine phosphatase
MSRELLVFRHGKSDWDSEEGGDFGRPLSGRGHKAVKRMAGWLGDQDLLPDHILSSTALRAEQTTLGLCEHAGIPTSTITWTETIYEAGVSTLLTVLSEAGSEWGRLMIVGHNPGFESLVRSAHIPRLPHGSHRAPRNARRLESARIRLREPHDLRPPPRPRHLICPRWSPPGPATIETFPPAPGHRSEIRGG